MITPQHCRRRERERERERILAFPFSLRSIDFASRAARDFRWMRTAERDKKRNDATVHYYTDIPLHHLQKRAQKFATCRRETPGCRYARHSNLALFAHGIIYRIQMTTTSTFYIADIARLTIDLTFP